MKFFLWVYAVVGALYMGMYSMGEPVVVRHAVGPFWLLLMAAPVILALLVGVTIAQRLGILGK